MLKALLCPVWVPSLQKRRRSSHLGQARTFSCPLVPLEVLVSASASCLVLRLLSAGAHRGSAVGVAKPYLLFILCCLSSLTNVWVTVPYSTGLTRWFCREQIRVELRWGSTGSVSLLSCFAGRRYIRGSKKAFSRKPVQPPVSPVLTAELFPAPDRFTHHRAFGKCSLGSYQYSNLHPFLSVKILRLRGRSAYTRWVTGAFFPFGVFTALGWPAICHPPRTFRLLFSTRKVTGLSDCHSRFSFTVSELCPTSLSKKDSVPSISLALLARCFTSNKRLQLNFSKSFIRSWKIK